MSTWIKIPDTKTGEDLAEESVEVTAASIMVTGGNISQVAKELSLNYRQAKKLVNSDSCKAVIKKLGDLAYADALSAIKHGAQQRIKQAFEVVDKQLDKNNLKAAEMVFKLINPDMAPEQDQGDTSINIIMPNLTPTPTNITPKKDIT